MRSWYIEDAGGGCKAFCEVLVLVCEKPHLIYTRKMPLTWDKSITLEEMARLTVLDMMKEAGVTHNDYLYVCSGNIFYGLHHWLTENGYNWELTKMDGLAHYIAEKTFQEQIIDAGFPANIELQERNYRDFYRSIEAWIKEEPYRYRYFKNMEVRRKPERLRYLLRGNSGHTRQCYKCKNKIYPYSPIVQYRFRENGKKKSRYFHPQCSPHKPLKNKLEEVKFIWQEQLFTGVILPMKKATPCIICGLEISPGIRAIHAGKGKKVIYSHTSCVRNINDALNIKD